MSETYTWAELEAELMSETYTWAELEAAMLCATLCQGTHDPNPHEDADRIIELAERIKAERQALASRSEES